MVREKVTTVTQVTHGSRKTTDNTQIYYRLQQIKYKHIKHQTFALYGKALQLPVPVPAPSSWALAPAVREQKMRNI